MKRIAVVEDEVYMREELCNMLQKDGYLAEAIISKIGSVRFGVQINNLFNTEYCNNGYGYSSIVGGVREDSAFYFPQAMFNVLANVTVRF